MQVSVEKVSNVERRLTIVVPSNLVEDAYVKQIEQFAKKANIKGFRPGKAPMNVITQRFGDDARKEALGEVIQRALFEAITEQKLNPISTPRVEPKIMEPNKPLEFTASFEVLPEIGDVQFKLDELEKPVVEVHEEDITRVIDQLKKQYTKWQVVDRPAKEKDRVVIDYYPIFDGKADQENKIENFPLELGGKMMLPGFEEGLMGAKAGDEKTLDLTFPADFHVQERAGKPIQFIVNVKQIFEAEMPKMDEAFIKQLGVKTGKEEELRTQIRQSLEQERNRLVSEKVKEQLFRNLIEQNAIEVPQSLVEREAKNIHDEMYPQHQHHEHNHSDEENNAFLDIAKKRVALGLLIAEYAKKSNILADKERVNQRIKEIASAYENPQEVITWLSSDERRGGIESQVMEDQVMDKLMENTKVIEKIMSYAELKGIRI